MQRQLITTSPTHLLMKQLDLARKISFSESYCNANTMLCDLVFFVSTSSDLIDIIVRINIT